MASPQLTEPQDLPPSPGLGDTTLRQIVRVSLGGKLLRVHFSNAFGTAPLTINAAHVASPICDGAILPETDRGLTFHGAVSVTVPPCGLAVSDPVGFDLAPLSDLAVTIQVRDLSPTVTGHPGARCTTYLKAGDMVSASTLAGAATTQHWYYLNGVDVAAPSAAVAILGDSLTDGRGSTTDGNSRWPDVLARRLQMHKETAHIAVLNAGLGGNRVCADGLGPSVLARLERDVLAQSGIRWLILLAGINDLGTGSASAQDLIAAYAQIIRRAHAKGFRVFGGTLTPCGGSFYFCPEFEAERQAVNAWIRTEGHFDAVVDFDAAMCDPKDPTRLRAGADCGDHLHLNDIGYRLLAEAIDLQLFAGDRPS